MTHVSPFDNQHPTRSPGADATSTTARAPLERTAGRYLWRVGWALVALLSVIVYVAGVPLYYDHVRALSSSDIDAVSTRAGLAHLGLSTNAYALALVTGEVIFTVVFVAVACLIVVRKPDDPFVAAISLSLIAFGTTFPRVDYALIDAYPQFTLPISLLLGAGFVCFFVSFYLFPDGRFVPSWTRTLVPLWIVMEAGHFLLDQSSILGWANNALFVVLVASAVFAQIHRYRHVSVPVQQQQTKWVVMGLAVAVVGFAGYGLTKTLIEPGTETVAHEIIAGPLMVAAFLTLPISIGFAVLHHRLWDIDIIVNRALVYAALTLSVAGIYVLVVGYLGAILHSEGNLVISLVATGIVAVLFETMHGWFKRQVNRLMYGARDDPYDVITQLGQRLETTTAVDAVLPAIVETIAQALKLPYAAISITRDNGLVAVSSFGTPAGDILRIPLVHQSEAVGRLDLAPRAPGEAFSPADWRVLNGIASQAGVAAHAVRLSADLQRSRERLVTAREEERRRIRRDLHDGLGPALGGISLK
ncbi:MAG TPA: GAF domain-containing protein, partial [Thermomicrobiales bacterium]|nr:GAF domain-containing protein [Thermomicrobiales bacterium]